MSSTTHDYYPLGIEIKGYTPNNISVPSLLVLFAFAWASIVALVWGLCSWKYPTLKKGEKWTVMWLVLSGTIHFFFEGYFSLNHLHMGSQQDIIGQLWKEYALSDSRYLTADTFVVCMESMTAFIMGPLCFFTAYLLLKKCSLRHPIQIITCVGQIYGLILYYGTERLSVLEKGVQFSRDETWYFWGYYVGINAIWFVVPGLLLVDSVKTIAKEMGEVKKLNDKIVRWKLL